MEGTCIQEVAQKYGRLVVPTLIDTRHTATNIGAIGVLTRTMGRPTVVIYLVTIVVVTLAFGLGLDAMLDTSGFTLGADTMAHGDGADRIKDVAAVVLLALGALTVVRKLRSRPPQG